MEIIDIKVSDLKPYEKNPRKNDPAVEPLMNSIREFGFKVPIVIDKDNVIVCGHTRWKAAKKLGMKSVPCIMADDLTDEQIKAFRVADNKTGEFAQWDEELLKFELDGLFDFDMEQFGFEVNPLESDEYEERTCISERENEYQIIVDCSDEIDMEEKYNQIKELGFECRLSTL